MFSFNYPLGGSKNPAFPTAFFLPPATGKMRLAWLSLGWGSECLGSLPKSQFSQGKEASISTGEMQG